MGWREDLKEASLDGVEFQYEDVSGDIGADIAIHDVATSGRPVAEPISEGAELFTLNAWIVGDDYMVDRDRMIEVLRKPATHRFVHPTRGTFQVALASRVKTSERRTEQGMWRASFTLIVVEDQAFPIIRDGRTDVLDQVGVLNLALLDSYSRRFKLGAFVKKITGAIGLATAAMRAVEGKIQSAMNITESFGDAVTGFTSQADSLLRKPGDMVNGMTSTALGIFGGITSFADGLPNSVQRSQSTFTQGLDLIFAQERPEASSISTPENDLEFSNSVEWWLTNRVSFLSAAASTTTDLVFTSSDEVFVFQDQFLDFFDQIAQDPDLDDQLYVEVRQLKAVIFGYLAQVAQQLPQITTYTTRKTLPSLVIAYTLYQDASRDLEVVARNNIKRPTFVSAQPLEVLSDG